MKKNILGLIVFSLVIIIGPFWCQYTFIIGDKGVQGRGISRKRTYEQVDSTTFKDLAIESVLSS